MTITKFDTDPEALAWARSKVEGFVAKMSDFERQSKERGDERLERQWRVFGNMAHSHFVGGEGCVIAAFDERLPKILPMLKPTL